MKEIFHCGCVVEIEPRKSWKARRLEEIGSYCGLKRMIVEALAPFFSKRNISPWAFFSLSSLRSDYFLFFVAKKRGKNSSFSKFPKKVIFTSQSKGHASNCGALRRRWVSRVPWGLSALVCKAAGRRLRTQAEQIQKIGKRQGKVGHWKTVPTARRPWWPCAARRNTEERRTSVLLVRTAA